jgi:hypothetical protein
VGPYELVSPWFVDYFSFIGYGFHCQGVTITDSQWSENVALETFLRHPSMRVNLFQDVGTRRVDRSAAVRER